MSQQPEQNKTAERELATLAEKEFPMYYSGFTSEQIEIERSIKAQREAFKKGYRNASQQTASLQKQLKELQEEFTMRVNYYENKIERMVNSNAEHTEYLQKQVEELTQQVEAVKDRCANEMSNYIAVKDILKALNPQDNQ